MASFALSATTGGALKHAWTKILNIVVSAATIMLKYVAPTTKNQVESSCILF